jgi:hypothetical protein
MGNRVKCYTISEQKRKFTEDLNSPAKAGRRRDLEQHLQKFLEHPALAGLFLTA